MMKHSKVEDMIKPRYEIHVMYYYFGLYSVQTKTMILTDYLYL
jgi:hypothetical protein